MTPPKTDAPGMARQREKKLQRRSKFGPLLLGLLIVGGIVAILIPLYLARNMMMGSGTPLKAARDSRFLRSWRPQRKRPHPHAHGERLAHFCSTPTLGWRATRKRDRSLPTIKKEKENALEHPTKA